MKNFLKENKFIVILLAVILGFAFYWYEWRPAQIREKCYVAAETLRINSVIKQIAKKRGQTYNGSYQYSGETINERYTNCLREKGLAK